jgi:hypothetical protein
MDLLWAWLHRIEPLLCCVTRLHPIIYHSGGSRVSVDYVHSISLIHSLNTQTQCFHFEVVEPLSEHEAMSHCNAVVSFLHSLLGYRNFNQIIHRRNDHTLNILNFGFSYCEHIVAICRPALWTRLHSILESGSIPSKFDFVPETET